MSYIVISIFLYYILIMAIKFQQTSQKAKLIIIAEFLFVSYLLYSLTTSVYKSYQIDVHIKDYETENARIEEENRLKSEDFDYYSSDAYIEKIAKQNLGLVNQGEEVILIPGESFENSEGAQNGLADDENRYSYLSNPQKWWKLFFDTQGY
jgi:cell division protein FtsB